MPIFLIMIKRLRAVPMVSGTSTRKLRTAGAAAAVGLAAMTFVRPPPQGFRVGDLVVGMAQNGRFESISNSVKPWIAQMIFVMFSAAMLGLAQLVYTHFMKKWEQRGLPVLPISALRPGAGGPTGGWSPGTTSFPGQQAQQAQAGPGPGSAAPQNRPAAAPGRTGIDEYKD